MGPRQNKPGLLEMSVPDYYWIQRIHRNLDTSRLANPTPASGGALVREAPPAPPGVQRRTRMKQLRPLDPSGHNLCTADPWIGQELHPTVRGQAAYAVAFRAAGFVS